MTDSADIDRFVLGGYEYQSRLGLDKETLAESVPRLLDPKAATETVHWQRNYLYAAVLEGEEGPIEVVVKQFPGGGGDSRGSKAARSWRMALEFLSHGLPTPEPVLLAEATDPRDASFFVTRRLGDVLEARYLLRAVNVGEEQDKFPHVDVELFLVSLGHLVREMHESGIWHRDLSIGNVLISRPNQPGAGAALHLLDLNRARLVPQLSNSQRTRDLCRMALDLSHHQRIFLEAYWGEPLASNDSRWRMYRLYRSGFLGRVEAKRKVRRVSGKLRRLFLGRGTHAHIPAAPSEASTRDRIVWDHLSDQPHQHATRWQRLRVRGSDFAAHTDAAISLLGSVPGIWSRYRELTKQLHTGEVSWGIPGISVRPGEEDPKDLLKLIRDLGSKHVLVRIHPWEEERSRELELSRRLSGDGYNVAFALPQNRDLVRDLSRWRSAVEEIAEQFSPFGRHFQIGQAVNRSKWGVWTYREYIDLAEVASEVLREYDGVELLGPAVIDFEFHALASILNLRKADVHFEIVSSLLYVDRRGAPEASQLGFDSVGKVTLLKAIAETSASSGDRCWIPEFNWPLWEGPHSPAGKTVSVDEDTQANYLVRYFLLVLGTGFVERVYWWQMIARGYGLVEPSAEGLRRRPSFHAMATLIGQLEGSTFLGPIPAEAPAHLYRFRTADGGETIVGWSAADPARVQLPGAVQRITTRDGRSSAADGSSEGQVTGSPTYFRLSD